MRIFAANCCERGDDKRARNHQRRTTMAVGLCVKQRGRQHVSVDADFAQSPSPDIGWVMRFTLFIDG